jgi:PAS domain S-box-containing protein
MKMGREVSSKEIEKLRKELASLHEENEVLTERAEDIFLFGVVAEKIGFAVNAKEVINIALESVSTLKDIDYCAYISLSDNSIMITEDFGSKLLSSQKGKTFKFDDSLLNMIQKKEYFHEIAADSDIPEFIPRHIDNQRPNAYYLMPIILQGNINGIILFVNYIGKHSYLKGILPLIMRIVEVVRNRLEIFSLLAEIKEMNRILETKIEERTDELKKANIKLRCEITDRILKEDAIEVSQKRFLAVLDSLDAIVYVADMETYELYYLNKFAREIFGNVIGKTCWKSLQLDQKSPCDFCSNDMLVDEKGNPKGVYKWEFQNTRNGHWYDIRDRAIYWVDGRLVRLEIATDITERKQAEEALRVRQEMIRALIETSRDWIWSIDLKGMHTYCNSAIEAILGYRPEELVGKRSLDFMHEDDRKMVEGKMPVYIAEKQGWNNLLIRWRHKDGSWRFLESNAVPILNAKGVLIGFRGVDRDITDRKKAEEEKEKLENQLRQAQKMEAIGQLAGGVAHDFNNILTAIIGYGDIIQMKLKEDDPLRIYIDQILASSDRAANLIQSLLAFSRKQIINTHPINLNKLVEGIEKILLRVIGEDIKLRTILAEEEVTVMADSGQIEQVLMNLATNARDAMPEGGLLIIETGLLEFDKEFIAAHEVVKPGKYMRR